MKIVFAWLVIGLMAAAIPLSSDAQILKNLVNNMKQNLTSKGTAQAAPGSGKPDSSARPKSLYDSAYLAQALAKANRPKPSISAADSAAAIKSFMTGTGGGGLLYQFRVVYNFTAKKKDSVLRDTMTLAITDGHNLRTDMGMPGSKMEVLGHAGMPRYSVIVYPDSKTYVFNIIDTAAINSSSGITYQATKVGNETVQGYNCIHSRLTTILPGQKPGITEDIWTSADVPGYTTLKQLATIQNVTPKMMQALEQAGCGGFFVKMSMQTKELSMEMLLVGAGRKTFPDALFRIPVGYTQGNPVNSLLRPTPQR